MLLLQPPAFPIPFERKAEDSDLFRLATNHRYEIGDKLKEGLGFSNPHCNTDHLGDVSPFLTTYQLEHQIPRGQSSQHQNEICSAEYGTFSCHIPSQAPVMWHSKLSYHHPVSTTMLEQVEQQSNSFCQPKP
jgi:hypothetical protein